MDPLESRQRILEAAEARFRRYGFAKSTMSEIATDCSMSAGNLYRYFDSKEEIGAQVAMRCIRGHEEIGRIMLGRRDLNATGKLERFVTEVALDTHERVVKDRELNDLVLYITEKRNDVVEPYTQNLIDLISLILAEGDASGEFEIEDLATTARTVLFACKSVVHPLLLAESSLQGTEANARMIVRLLVKGLRPS